MHRRPTGQGGERGGVDLLADIVDERVVDVPEYDERNH
jgi:hypothetical protein